MLIPIDLNLIESNSPKMEGHEYQYTISKPLLDINFSSGKNGPWPR